LTHVKVQNWMTTGLPRKSSGLSGCEFSHAVAPFSEGRLPSVENVGWKSAVDCVFAQARPIPAAARVTAPVPMKCRLFLFTPQFA
jgi:hypothetical protein